MTFSLDALLETYRSAALTEREEGTYFERLCVAYLRHDPVQAAQYDEVLTWTDWAKSQGFDGKDIGIVNDANNYANGTVGDPRYPFDLLCRVSTVSLETMKIVRALPPLEI